jgi:hypothetical protein
MDKRKEIINIVDDMEYENMKRVFMYILTQFGRGVIHTHGHGSSLNLDKMSDNDVGLLYKFIKSIDEKVGVSTPRLNEKQVLRVSGPPGSSVFDY